jgi:hypothetical protein
LFSVTPRRRRELLAETAARLLLTLGALLPYRLLLTFRVLYVTDDGFVSDIFNGELPGRVLMGQLIRDGQVPLWTSQLCTGSSLAGGIGDPIGLAAFSLLPPAAALDLLAIVLILVAAHGAYGLARRFGAARPGGVLAGLAFAGSGYIACHLKHLTIVSTVVWLPIGLALLDRVLGPNEEEGSLPQSSGSRRLAVPAFGLVFAEQVLSGFPQSAYICALTYGSFVAFRAFTQRHGANRVPLRVLAAIGLATAVGAAAGAVVLMPLNVLGTVSDRNRPLGLAWSTAMAYWPPNVMMFLIPYINGDVSNLTNRPYSVFWEDYAYVGAAPFLLALYAARERRRRLVAFSIGMTIIAFLLVLGRWTPVYPLAYLVVPGLRMFRLPTRFLIVVDLGLAVLGGIGLTRLHADLERRFATVAPRVPRLIVVALCVGTGLDLWFHQPRQNPIVPAADWLAPPASAQFIRARSTHPRTVTPGHRDLHLQAYRQAHGWADVTPYFQLRDLLGPNTGGGLWDVPSADCYAGIAPRWQVDVWGDHNREGLVVSKLSQLDLAAGTLRVRPALLNVLRTFGVTHLLSAYPVEGLNIPPAGHEGTAYIYEVEGAARLRFVRAGRLVKNNDEAAARLKDISFDPEREILLHEAPETVGPTVDNATAQDGALRPANAVITREDSSHLLVEADAPADGFLLLADTFYPGWEASVDGQLVPIYRANISARAIQLPKGRHDVQFVYRAPRFWQGLRITLLALSLLLVWCVVAIGLNVTAWRRRLRRGRLGGNSATPTLPRIR